MKAPPRSQSDPNRGGRRWRSFPDGREFSAYGEVEALPNGEFVVASRLRDDNSNPGTGVTVLAPDGTVRRVLLDNCFGIEQDSVQVAATADGTIYYTRAYDGTQENVGDEFWVVDGGVSGDLSYVGLR